MAYKDPTPISPSQIDYDKSKIDPQVANYTKQVREKMYGEDTREAMARAEEISSVVSTEAKEISVETKGRQDILEQQFDDQISNMTLEDPSSAEIVAAQTNRKTGENWQTIGNRLDDENNRLTEQLATTDEQITVLYKTETNIESFKKQLLEENDQGRFQRAVQQAKDTTGVVRLPVGIYRIPNFGEIPMGVSVVGATDCYYDSGYGIGNKTIILTDTVESFAVLRGANVIKNLAIVYVNQTYSSDSMIDTGITFDIVTKETEYAKAGLIEGVSVIGGTTIISNLENADYFSIDRLSFTPNYLKPSIRITNAYDLVRIGDIHCNANLAWGYKENTLIPSRLSTSILAKIQETGKLFEFGRVDEVMITRPFSYGIPFPITITTINEGSNGGITLNNAVFDTTYRVLNVDATMTNFGIQINGLKAVFVSKNDSCLFNFTANSQGTRVQATNIYVPDPLGKTWSPCRFESGSTNNKVIVSNFNFHNPTDNYDVGTNNTYSCVNGYGGANGLVPINTMRDENSSYYPVKMNGKSKVQTGVVTISFTIGDSTKTQNFSYPNGSFSTTPDLILTVLNDAIGDRDIFLKASNITTTGFTVRATIANSQTASATGVLRVSFAAFGN